MTQGFTRPFTPSGRASIIPALPWKFAGDMILIRFRADPAALARYLPEPLTPQDDSGEAYLWTVDWACHPGQGDLEAIDGAQTSYNVCVIGIPAMLDGKPTVFSAFQWCDADWLIVLSWAIGATSKGADFYTTRLHPFFEKLDSPHAGPMNTHIHRGVSRFGQRIVDIHAKFDREADPADLAKFTSNLPMTGMRHMPDISLPPVGKPPIHDLVQVILSNSHMSTPLAGTATLKFGEHANEELLPIQPIETLGAFRLSLAQNLEGIKVVHDYTA